MDTAAYEALRRYSPEHLHRFQKAHGQAVEDGIDEERFSATSQLGYLSEDGYGPAPHSMNGCARRNEWVHERATQLWRSAMRQIGWSRFIIRNSIVHIRKAATNTIPTCQLFNQTTNLPDPAYLSEFQRTTT